MYNAYQVGRGRGRRAGSRGGRQACDAVRGLTDPKSVRDFFRKNIESTIVDLSLLPLIGAPAGSATVLVDVSEQRFVYLSFHARTGGQAGGQPRIYICRWREGA